MRSGMLDLFTSRRTMHDKCNYWRRESNEDINALIHEINEPSGFFYAKQITSIQDMPQVLAGVFLFDSETVTIQSNDELDKLKRDDIIQFRGEIWRLEQIQATPIRINNQYNYDVQMTYFLRLKR
jgi:hypothetical protein